METRRNDGKICENSSIFGNQSRFKHCLFDFITLNTRKLGILSFTSTEQQQGQNIWQNYLFNSILLYSYSISDPKTSCQLMSILIKKGWAVGNLRTTRIWLPSPYSDHPAAARGLSTAAHSLTRPPSSQQHRAK